MNVNTIKEMDLDSKQPKRQSKRRAEELISGWVNHVHSVGGGNSTDDWHSSSTGIHGDSTEEDDEESSEPLTEELDQSSSDNLQGDSDRESDVLLKVWGPFLRRGTANDPRKEKRPRINSPTDSGGEDLSRDLGSTSDFNDYSQEGSDGSFGSLKDFIC